MQPKEIESEYVFGEMVWAKVKGHPWWPGIVQKVNLKSMQNSSRAQFEYEIAFVGEKSHSRLPGDKLAKYQENYSKYSNLKKPKLIASIQSAQRIIKGTSTLAEEYNLLPNRARSSSKKKVSVSSIESVESEQSSNQRIKSKSSKPQKNLWRIDKNIIDIQQMMQHNVQQLNKKNMNTRNQEILGNELEKLIERVDKFIKEFIENAVGEERSETIQKIFSNQWGNQYKQIINLLQEHKSIPTNISKELNIQRQKFFDFIQKFFSNEFADQPALSLESEFTTPQKQQTLLPPQTAPSHQLSTPIQKLPNSPTLSASQKKQQKLQKKINKPALLYLGKEKPATNNNNTTNGVELIQTTVQQPELRKKVCQKLAHIAQQQLGIERKIAQELILGIEAKIRAQEVEMETGYKDKISTLFHLVKYECLTSEQLKELAKSNFEIDFDYLKKFRANLEKNYYNSTK